MTGPWAVPGSAPAQPDHAVADAVPAAPAGPARPAPHGDPALPPPPLPMRPMTIPDLLDGSFAVLKRRPRDVVLLAAAFVVPVQVVAAFLLRDVLDAEGFGGIGLGDPSSVGFDEGGEIVGLGPFLFSQLLDACSLALLAGAIAQLVLDWYDGVRRTPGETLALTLRRAPALVVGVVVVHLLEAIGLVGLGVGAYVAMALLHVVAPVIVAERVGPFRAVGRSVRLTSTTFGRSLAVPGLVALVGLLVGFGFGLVPEVAAALVPADWAWLARSAGSTLSQLVVAPFTAGVAVLYHLDLRIRAEGYDLVRRLDAARVR